MKSFIKIVSIISFLVGIQITSFANGGGDKEKSVKSIAIKTSAQCQDCRDRIEYELTFKSGVISTDFDAMTGKLLVKYRTKKINADELREVISLMGYDADHVRANEAAFKVLPKTCRVSTIE